MNLHEFLELNLSRPEVDRVLVRDRFGRCVYCTELVLSRDTIRREIHDLSRELHKVTITVEGKRDRRYGDRPTLASFPE